MKQTDTGMSIRRTEGGQVGSSAFAAQLSLPKPVKSKRQESRFNQPAGAGFREEQI
jgi:hypothetical protein